MGDIEYLLSMWEGGPYFLRDKFSFIDVVMAPWFERMKVLEHYRGFEVPYTE